MATSLSRAITTPTNEQPDKLIEQNNGYFRLLPRFREGVISFEVFDKRKRDRLPIDPYIMEDDNASKKQTAAKVGLRGQGGSVGKAASLQPTEKRAKAEEAVTRAKARKRSSK